MPKELTPYLEANALLAVINENQEQARDILVKMSHGELKELGRACTRLYRSLYADRDAPFQEECLAIGGPTHYVESNALLAQIAGDTGTVGVLIQGMLSSERRRLMKVCENLEELAFSVREAGQISKIVREEIDPSLEGLGPS